jgi:hypothetical protein
MAAHHIGKRQGFAAEAAQFPGRKIEGWQWRPSLFGVQAYSASKPIHAMIAGAVLQSLRAEAQSQRAAAPTPVR